MEKIKKNIGKTVLCHFSDFLFIFRYIHTNCDPDIQNGVKLAFTVLLTYLLPLNLSYNENCRTVN